VSTALGLRAFIRGLPKAELHIHIEGSLEPEMMLRLARRGGLDVPYASVDEVRAAYDFGSLQDFLDIYYAGARVLRTEEDFHDLAWAYLQRAHADTVRHVEIFFDPQTHTERGIAFATVIEGLHAALEKGRKHLGISWRLIPCFLRHLPEAAAEATLDEALGYRTWITAFGLDSSEAGHPPEAFARVFDRVRAEGFLTVAHAGEEGPADYIRQALDLLHVSRVDHGVRCMEDEALVARLARDAVPLTVCPQSNVRLRVFESIEDHNLAELLRRGLKVTVNSDDPAYFGGYINANYEAVAEGLALTRDEVLILARNSFDAAFLDDETRRSFLSEIDAYAAGQRAP